MAYAQKDYSQVQGISGQYKISSIGCFLTAFSNLLGSYGKDINPFSLNNEFVSRNIYIDIDDGIRDDLGWSSISQYDPSINVTGTADRGTTPDAGWPSSSEAIVRFYYRSVQSGQMIFHFCKVYDAVNHLIVDSWDGQVKTSPYGEPTGWATYSHSEPVQVAPPAAIPYTKENITPKQIVFNKDTHLWNLSKATFDEVAANPTGDVVANPNAPITVDGIIHHNAIPQYSYYTNEEPFGFNVLDCDDYTPPPPPPVAPPAGAVTIPTSTAPYSIIKTIMGFSTSNDAANHINAKGTVDPGRYMLYNFRVDSEGKTIALNVTKTQGKPGTWINPDDNVPDLPPPPPEAATEPPAPLSTVTPNEPTPVPVNVPNHDLWKTTYVPLRADRKPVLYVSINPKVIKIYDLDQRHAAIDLLPYTELHIVGTFIKDGVTYGRAKKVTEKGYWYGIPITILNTYDELYLYAPKKAPKLSDYAHLLGAKINKLIHDVTRSKS
jgi:hypothetical protein